MSTLLLKLSAPLQSWGADSKFDRRDTRRVPTKSGVIGLLACALGWGREHDLEQLCKLKFGVRVDQEGDLLRDFQTVESQKSKYVTNRYYLADWKFTAGLESDDEAFLHELETALKNPKWPLFLGRRSCPPAEPVVIGVNPAPLREALSLSENQWAVFDADGGQAFQRDLPRSFSSRHRQYDFRRIEEKRNPLVQQALSDDVHDAFSEVE
jgi:CRISPR system Cascade subunit CasD